MWVVENYINGLMILLNDMTRMNIYFAPLEGITGYLYRNAFQKAFNPKINKYFSPFISPGPNQSLTNKELRDILPENNRDINLIPQVLTNSASDFLSLSERLNDMGYDEVNINLGCPSGTVVSKKRGAGLLGEPEMLECMLDEIYSKTDMKISLKTRIGKESAEEFPKLLEIYNKFPVYELIIHPRIRNDFYKGKPDMEAFDMAISEANAKLCYNGDIFSKADYENIVSTYPELDSVMIGRGFLRNPMLYDCIICGVSPDKAKIREFHEYLMGEYSNYMSGERPVLFKMKELWSYMLDLLEDSEKPGKKIKKATSIAAYNDAVAQLFEVCEIKKC